MNVIVNFSPGEAAGDQSVQHVLNRIAPGALVLDDGNDLSPIATIDGTQNEKLILTGHGTPQTIGGANGTKYSAVKVAEMLAGAGLRGPVNIDVYCCETALLSNPFALELKVTLVQRYKIWCSVTAPNGYLSPHSWDDAANWDVEDKNLQQLAPDKAFSKFGSTF